MSKAAKKSTETSDASDFYFFIYDEEDKSNMQTQLKKKGKSYGFNKANKQRVFGFWCFNAGVGFKQL